MVPQVPRLALAFGAIIAGFLAFRSLVVPESFGEKGFYRADFVAEAETMPLAHAGREACMGCHQDVADRTVHFQFGVGCESCHGPSLAHVENFERFRPAKLSTRDACGRCHAKVVGRPASFPTMDLKTHFPGERCISCHAIHEPPEGSDE